MTIISSVNRKRTQLLASIFLLAGLLISSPLTAQQIVAGSQSQTGTIQKLSQDDGRLTISGQVYGYSDAITQVLIDKSVVRVEVLTEGMVVRYSLNSSGTLTKLEIIGPANKVRELTSN